MSVFQKVVVVDDGDRTMDRALSAELAELGFASVTTSYEATDDVLELIPSPSAIVVQLPRRSAGSDYDRLVAWVERLKEKQGAAGIPVIVVDPRSPRSGSYAAMLQNGFASRAVAKPEL